MSTTDDNDARGEFIAGLRAAADFLEQAPVARCSMGGDTCTLYHYVTTGDEFLKVAEMIGGPFEHDPDTHYFKLVRRFGPVSYQLFTENREVGTSRPVRVTEEKWVLHAEVRDRLAALKAAA